MRMHAVTDNVLDGIGMGGFSLEFSGIAEGTRDVEITYASEAK